MQLVELDYTTQALGVQMVKDIISDIYWFAASGDFWRCNSHHKNFHALINQKTSFPEISN